MRRPGMRMPPPYAIEQRRNYFCRGGSIQRNSTKTNGIHNSGSTTMTITAKIIADSISEQNIRITSIQCRYPKFIHGEFLTHRQFSRNSSSSRAIPVERLIKDVEDDPVIPSFWGKNQKGMQANEECDELINQGIPREDAWIAARDHAIKFARMFNNAGYHKQIVNRLLEPF